MARIRRGLCRATAAAIFGDPDKVDFTPLTSKQGLVHYKDEIDVLYVHHPNFSRDKPRFRF